ncbi:tRNA dihydrouridine synthase [Caballeronia sp. KNU42]
MSRLFLAPMEGLADYVLRDVLTSTGGFDGCVSEFVRVTGSVLPRSAYERETPEILHGGRTPAGTPMVIQLLGSDPEWMALNAAQAASLSPHGIDLNFGCPAKIVNRHGGGAMLLAHPEQLNRIVSSVRAAVPAAIAVTAKMRLGVSDTSLAIDCATALAEGGVASLVVHARTRDHGYRPPAHWEWIAHIDAAVDVPVVANGEVWTVADWARCREVSGCADLMIGRGAVSDPFLALRIRGLMAPTPSGEEWPAVLGQLAGYLRKLQLRVASRHEHGRVKMWLSYLKRTWPQATKLHAAIRRLHDAREILEVIECALAFNNLMPERQRATLVPLVPVAPRRLPGCTVAGAVQ